MPAPESRKPLVWNAEALWPRLEAELPGLSIEVVARTLSTNHFCYDGYWIWFIPLSCDLISLGMVIDAGVLATSGDRTKAVDRVTKWVNYAT